MTGGQLLKSGDQPCLGLSAQGLVRYGFAPPSSGDAAQWSNDADYHLKRSWSKVSFLPLRKNFSRMLPRMWPMSLNSSEKTE